MQPHQQRVVDEKKDLDEKLGRLRAFIDGPGIFHDLGAAEQERMNRQARIMAEYSAVLGERIAAF